MPVGRALLRNSGAQSAGADEYLLGFASAAAISAAAVWKRTGESTFAAPVSDMYSLTSNADAQWSSDGLYLVELITVGTNNTSTISVFKRTPGSATHTRSGTMQNFLNDQTACGATFTPDLTGVLVATQSTGLLSIGFNARSGTLAGSYAGVGGAVACNGPARFTPDGLFVVAPITASPFLTARSRLAGTNSYTVRAVPADLPATPVAPPAWHPAGALLAVVANNASGYGVCTVFTRSGTTLAAANVTVGGTVARSFNSAAYSPDGTLLALTSLSTSASPFVFLYAVDAATGALTALADVPLASGVTAGYRKAIWSADAQTLFLVPSGTNAGLYVYRRAGNTFTSLGQVLSGALSFMSGTYSTNVWTALSPATT